MIVFVTGVWQAEPLNRISRRPQSHASSPATNKAGSMSCCTWLAAELLKAVAYKQWSPRAGNGSLINSFFDMAPSPIWNMLLT